MGRARDELAQGVRSFSFGRYIIFYAPSDDGIEVVRVLHPARDVDSTFGERYPALVSFAQEPEASPALGHDSRAALLWPQRSRKPTLTGRDRLRAAGGG